MCFGAWEALQNLFASWNTYPRALLSLLLTTLKESRLVKTSSRGTDIHLILLGVLYVRTDPVFVYIATLYFSMSFAVPDLTWEPGNVGNTILYIYTIF